MREVPTIDVFAGENQTVEEGDEVDYVARFTRPAELRDFEYQWEFGDGSPTVTGSIEDGESRIAVSHEYSDFRPRPYEVVVTVSAMSDVGRVSSSGSFTVRVTEVEGFVVGGWDAGETAKTAIRALTVSRKGGTGCAYLGGDIQPGYPSIRLSRDTHQAVRVPAPLSDAKWAKPIGAKSRW